MKRSPLSLSLSFPPLLLHSSIKTKITQIGRRADYHSFNQQQANKKKKKKGTGKWQSRDHVEILRAHSLSLSHLETETRERKRQMQWKIKRGKRSKGKGIPRKRQKKSPLSNRELSFSPFFLLLSLSLLQSKLQRLIIIRSDHISFSMVSYLRSDFRFGPFDLSWWWSYGAETRGDVMY